ncbi:unnamed protein product [Calypogeia fissa]
MVGMAVGVVESSCVRGSCPAVVNGGQPSVSRSIGACFVPLPQLRTSVVQQADGGRRFVRCTQQPSRATFGAKVLSRPTTVVPRSTVADYPSVPKKPLDLYTVGDFMTRVEDLYCASPNTTVDEALEILVEKRITGLPVIDEQGRLVGVVSDYDLLALDSISGKRNDEGSLFPAANSTWKAFKEIQVLLGKTHGKTVGELMSPSPIVVRELTNIEDAARILLDTKFRRLPVVSDTGKLVGLLTREWSSRRPMFRRMLLLISVPLEAGC